jgi:germacradienol/geosmin synthase
MSITSSSITYAWRENPSVDLLRRDGDAWTYSMGLLPLSATPDEWSAIRLPECAAWCYPVVPRDELFLMYHVYAWMFALDLLFVRTFKARRDLDGARAMVDRLPLFMPLDGTARAMPEPENPIERSLADIWLRLAPTRSTAWKRDMLNAQMEYADGQCWELECIRGGRIPDPAEYLVRRRGSYGGPVGVCLAEHVAGTEVPVRVRRSRPFRALMDAWTDIQALHNDIRSYRREVDDEDETCNSVLVFAKFLELTTDQAAASVTRLRMARLSEYEHLETTQLPELCDQLRLDSEDREQVSAVMQAMRDHLTGFHVWQDSATRYQAPAPGQGPSKRLGS